MMSKKMIYMWAGEWYSHNRLDGINKHILYDNCLPVLFRTRKECREYIENKFGYIKTRQDLRDEPYGWRLPKAIKVQIVPVIKDDGINKDSSQPNPTV